MRFFLVLFSLMIVFFAGCSNSTQKAGDDSDVEEQDLETVDSDQDRVFGEVVQNPSGNIPLSAEIELFTDGISEVEVEVHDIVEGNLSFLRKYQIDPLDRKVFNIPVMGLFPDYKNRVTVKVFDKEAKLIDEKEFEIETDTLPYDFPEVTVSGDIESGWTIVNYLRTPRSRPEMNAIAVDELGRIRWFTDMPYPAVFPIRLYNGYLYLSDGADILYKYDFMGFEKEKWDVSQFGFTEIHHDIFIKEDGNILAAASKKDGDWSYDRIIEIDPEKGTLRGTWDLKTVFPDVCDLYHDIPFTEPGNPVNGANAPIHNNAVWHDPSDDSLIIASQRSGVAKLTHSGYLKWFLAPHVTAYIDDMDGDGISDSLADGYDPDDNSTRIGDFKGDSYTEDRMPIAGKPYEAYSSFDFRYQEFLLDPLDREGDLIEDEEILMGFANHEDFVWPFRVHSPVILENGNMMLFDNGLARNFSFPPISADHYSRAVELKITPDASDGYGGTVEQVWEYVIEESPLWYGFSPVVSNVEELENGNRLVVSGSLGSSFIPDLLRPMYGEGPAGGMVIEIDPSDNSEKNRLFFERYIDNDYPLTEFTLYRAHRFDLRIKVE